jgi:hypothetical protein
MAKMTKIKPIKPSEAGIILIEEGNKVSFLEDKKSLARKDALENFNAGHIPLKEDKTPADAAIVVLRGGSQISIEGNQIRIRYPHKDPDSPTVFIELQRSPES